MQRWIAHIDMDAFFASVEQRDEPALRGQPVIVGGLGPRGVVSTASYEARAFGVHSALPMSRARQLCPQGIFLPGNHAKYQTVSREIMTILSDYSPLVEPLSLDEAFLDITGMEWLFQGPRQLAADIKARILRETELHASAGVASNKLMAKVASDLDKPDGLVIVQPGTEAELLAPLPIRRLWGIGHKSAAVLCARGITTIGALASMEPTALQKVLGPAAVQLQLLARGHDLRPVAPARSVKSIGHETTFAADLYTWEELLPELLALTMKTCRRLRQSSSCAHTVTVKLRFSSFHTLTRSHSLQEETDIDDIIYETAKQLCLKIKLTEGVRLIGVAVSNLRQGSRAPQLFADGGSERLGAVSEALDRIRNKFGEDSITRASILRHK